MLLKQDIIVNMHFDVHKNQEEIKVPHNNKKNKASLQQNILKPRQVSDI